MSLIRKHFEDRESWQEGRQELGIGGSDAAAVCGLSPWMSPVELWKIKTGQKKQKDISGSAVVERGVRMEPALRNLYAAMNPQMQVEHYPYDILAQSERPWLTATLDGDLTDENGRRGILEIKTGQLMKKADYEKWADGNVPIYPHRCKKHKGERFSEVEWRRIVYSLYKCSEFKSVDATGDAEEGRQ